MTGVARRLAAIVICALPIVAPAQGWTNWAWPYSDTTPQNAGAAVVDCMSNSFGVGYWTYLPVSPYTPQQYTNNDSQVLHGQDINALDIQRALWERGMEPWMYLFRFTRMNISAFNSAIYTAGGWVSNSMPLNTWFAGQKTNWPSINFPPYVVSNQSPGLGSNGWNYLRGCVSNMTLEALAGCSTGTNATFGHADAGHWWMGYNAASIISYADAETNWTREGWAPPMPSAYRRAWRTTNEEPWQVYTTNVADTTLECWAWWYNGESRSQYPPEEWWPWSSNTWPAWAYAEVVEGTPPPPPPPAGEAVESAYEDPYEQGHWLQYKTVVWDRAMTTRVSSVTNVVVTTGTNYATVYHVDARRISTFVWGAIPTNHMAGATNATLYARALASGNEFRGEFGLTERTNYYGHTTTLTATNASRSFVSSDVPFAGEETGTNVVGWQLVPLGFTVERAYLYR